MAADLLRSFWHSLEDPVVHSFQAEATTESSLPLCQSRLNRWMVGTDGSSMLEMRYRFYENRTMTVFKSIKIHPPILGIIMCPRLHFNSDLDPVVGRIQDLYLSFKSMFTFKLALHQDSLNASVTRLKGSDWDKTMVHTFSSVLGRF